MKKNIIAVVCIAVLWASSLVYVYQVTAYTEYDNATESECSLCGGFDNCVLDIESGTWYYR